MLAAAGPDPARPRGSHHALLRPRAVRAGGGPGHHRHRMPRGRRAQHRAGARAERRDSRGSAAKPSARSRCACREAASRRSRAMREIEGGQLHLRASSARPTDARSIAACTAAQSPTCQAVGTALADRLLDAGARALLEKLRARAAVIPKIVPPLTDLTVLVTRPAAQCAMLCAEIERQGGSAIAFPAIEIEPVAAQATVASADYDLVVFVSVNAVEHGARLVRQGARDAHRGDRPGDGRRAGSRASCPPTSSRSAASQRSAARASAVAAGERRARADRAWRRRPRGAAGDVRRARHGGRDARGLSSRAPGRGRRRRRRGRGSAGSDEGIDVVTATSIETLQNLHGAC